ncbi:MAG: SPOR domain-containing protein [Gallionella sp.]|nr:SPOR domain-containing protein [Gallionella sp.]
MIRIASSAFIFLALILIPPAALGDFETDLSDTGKSDNSQMTDRLRVRAMAGDADAQLYMGSLFFKGQEVAQDYAEAAKWYRLAARQGYAQAQFNLGMMYDTGLGVGKNQTEAVRWYRTAAEQGLAIAQLNLGVAYAEGLGVSQNEDVAVKWFRLAASQGEAQAQFNLAVVYANGQGVTQNFVEAYQWARLAAAQGHEMARAMMSDLSRQMTPVQIASANKLADTGQRKMSEKPASANREKPVADAATENGDIYLQLGAFKSKIQAEKFRVLLSAKLGDVGRPFSLFTKDDFVRIHVGPYTSLSEARLSADSLKAKLGFEPLLKRH